MYYYVLLLCFIRFCYYITRYCYWYYRGKPGGGGSGDSCRVGHGELRAGSRASSSRPAPDSLGRFIGIFRAPLFRGPLIRSLCHESINF